MVEYRGRHDGASLRVAVIVSTFNVMVTERLLEGCRGVLDRHGVDPGATDVIHVPGAWEISGAARRAVRDGYDAVVALGCVVRGETPHFDYICRSVTQGLTLLQIEHDTPIGFGIVTADTLAQALERSGGRVGNLGEQAALAALEMRSLYAQLDGS